MPDNLATRPRHGRYPIPWVTTVRDGVPDFRVHDDLRRWRVATERRCQLCGFTMGRPVAMIGTARSADLRTFGEPPAHPACMDYAVAVCPWLNGSDASRRPMPSVVDVMARRLQPDTLILVTVPDFEGMQDLDNRTIGYRALGDYTSTRVVER